MKYKKNSFTFFTVIAVLPIAFTACDKTETSSFTDTAIVQSYLQPGDTFKLRVGRQIPFDTAVSLSADNINALGITLNYNGTSYSLTPLGNGYYTKSSVIMQQGDNYSVQFSFNAQAVSASTHIPTKPAGFSCSDSVIKVERQLVNTQGQPNATAPLDFTWTNSDNSYYFMMIQNMEQILDPISPSSASGQGKGFRKTPTNSPFDQLRGGDFAYYGRYRVILFHVLNDYAALYQQTNSSSQNLTNASSSIANGYGIFTGLNSDTLYINIKPL